ncbi:MAG TPA: 4-(cytidine 5'-diphospho)-2-C-methyl-D-erythritol kinase [Bacilli bacterium]
MIYKRAYAKLNLGLQVVNKRQDGYHNLKSIMIMIDLYDELFFEIDDDITLECNVDLCKKEDNLVYKAAKLISNRFHVNKGCKIKLHKIIPANAGLAGGSSDAAATIKALNELWELNLTYEEMIKLGAEIGSDVPFCIIEKPMIVEGRGEILKEYLDIPEMYFVLVFPDFSCSTKEIFKHHQIIQDDERFSHLVKAVLQKDINKVGNYLFNDLERTVEIVQNKDCITIIKNALIENGCAGSAMTGSGSTVFGITSNYENAQKIKNIMHNIFPKYRILSTKSYKK